MDTDCEKIDVTHPRIHVTDIAKFRKCRRAWDFSAVQCLKRNKYESGPYWFGTGLHEVLAKYYNAGGIVSGLGIKDLMQFWNEYCAKFFDPPTNADMLQRDKDNELIKSMLMQYLSFAKVNDVDWEIVEVEKELTAEIPGLNATLVATIDLLVRNKNNGNLYIVDHKGFQTFSGPEMLEFDYQMTAYMWICKRNGIKINTAVYNMLRKAVPTEPELLKNGALSKNKGIDTSYEAYMRAIRKYGLDEEDYTDILEKIKLNQYNIREKLFRTARQVSIFGNTLPYEIYDMLRCLEDDNLKYPNPDSGIFSECKRCSYKSLCMSMLQGGNTELTKATEYVIAGGRF